MASRHLSLRQRFAAVHRAWLVLFALAFLAHGLVPAGYMPSLASAGDGAWVSVCPAGLPAGVLSPSVGSDTAHAHHHAAASDGLSDEAGAELRNSFCSLGAAFQLAALTSPAPVLPRPGIAPPPSQTGTPALRHAAPQLRPPARAPPVPLV